MSITMNIAMFKNHVTKNINQIVGNYLWVDSKLLYFLYFIYFGSFNVFHYNDTFGRIFFIEMRDMNVRIIFQQPLHFFTILNLVLEI